MGKIHEYPLEATVLQDTDFADLDAFNSGTGLFQSKKISGLNLKDSVLTFITPNLDARDTANRNRANHTGTQDASTITGLAVVATSNDYNDLDNLPIIPVPLTAHSELILDDGTNPHMTTAADVGLGNVDNTSDLNKPISTATQLALDDKQDELISGVNIKTIDGQSILGAGDIPFPPSSVQKFNQQMYAFDMSQAAGFNWNGLNVGATGLVTLSERWRLQSFAGTGQPDGAFGNFCLPSTYTAGNDIRVVLKLTCGTAGNAFYGCGFTALNFLGGYGADADATYQTAIVPFLAGFNDDTLTFIFSGANLAPLRPIAINVYRDPQNAGNTNSAIAYINQIMIEEV
jgi:hypothetical protein